MRQKISTYGAWFSAIIITVFLALPSYAEKGFIEWHSTNIQGLMGSDYKLGEEDRKIITIEHANKWRYGDFYTFCDITYQDGKSGETAYCEATPRVSLSKVTGKDMSFGIIKDVFIAGQIEKGEGGMERYNIGPAVNLDIPNFKFFKVNLFLRNNPDREDKTFQVYTAWNMPFHIGETKMLFEGFADIFGEEGGKTVPSQLLQPRVLVDVGDMVWEKPGKLFVGFEYQYWHNKFGVDGVTESLPQLQVKWVF